MDGNCGVCAIEPPEVRRSDPTLRRVGRAVYGSFPDGHQTHGLPTRIEDMKAMFENRLPASDSD
jgi:hypothetical protein